MANKCETARIHNDNSKIKVKIYSTLKGKKKIILIATQHNIQWLTPLHTEKISYFDTQKTCLKNFRKTFL